VNDTEDHRREEGKMRKENRKEFYCEEKGKKETRTIQKIIQKSVIEERKERTKKRRGKEIEEGKKRRK
jgi:hypothetical protein